MIDRARPNFVTTRNPCTLCTPFGAAAAYAGFEQTVPLLHGSQGCATYVRRYLIGHFREPMDVASSNFHESAAIFGGQKNIRTAIANVAAQYRPRMIGVATTCLAETIGDDVPMFLRELRAEWDGPELPLLVSASTPSYRGSYTDGFAAATRAVLDALAETGPKNQQVNLLPGLVSPADIRYLKELMRDLGLDGQVIPDYADRLDGPAWEHYHRIPPGGTPLQAVRAAGSARATIEFAPGPDSPGELLAERFDVPHLSLPMPIGVRASDRLTDALTELAGRELPAHLAAERGRLIDALADGHKYVAGRRVVIYGELPLAVGLTALLTEAGLTPVIVASGSRRGQLRSALASAVPELPATTEVMDDVDFAEITEAARSADPELIVGNSNGLKLSRDLKIPLVRAGLPIHDRLGAARVLHVGYRGSLSLVDRVVNALIAAEQDANPVGYTHM